MHNYRFTIFSVGSNWGNFWSELLKAYLEAWAKQSFFVVEVQIDQKILYWNRFTTNNNFPRSWAYRTLFFKVFTCKCSCLNVQFSIWSACIFENMIFHKCLLKQKQEWEPFHNTFITQCIHLNFEYDNEILMISVVWN